MIKRKTKSIFSEEDKELHGGKKKLHNVAKCLAAQRRCKQSLIGEKDYKATRTINAGK